MKENGMIDAQEVLKLFDLYMQYGQDSYSQQALKALDTGDERRHVTTRRNMGRYIKEFINRKFEEKYNRKPSTQDELDSIIKTEGATKSMKYERKGIIEMLKDENVIEKLTKQFQVNTTLLEKVRVPKYVLEYYELNLSGIIEEHEAECFYNEIKDDSIIILKRKLSVIQKVINKRLEFKQLIEEYDEVAQSRSPESSYYYEIEE